MPLDRVVSLALRSPKFAIEISDKSCIAMLPEIEIEHSVPRSHDESRFLSTRSTWLIRNILSPQPNVVSPPEMATVPIMKCQTSNEVLPSAKLTDEKDAEKSDKKLTVLESHGYALGKTIGAGSYATVKVIVHFLPPTLFRPASPIRRSKALFCFREWARIRKDLLPPRESSSLNSEFSPRFCDFLTVRPPPVTGEFFIPNIFIDSDCEIRSTRLPGGGEDSVQVPSARGIPVQVPAARDRSGQGIETSESDSFLASYRNYSPVRLLSKRTRLILQWYS